MLSSKTKWVIGFLAIAFGLCGFGQSTHAAQTGEIKPEKNKLEVAVSATVPLY